MLTHDRLDSLRRFVGMVERNGRDEVVQDVSLNDAMEQLSTDEAEFTVDGGCCAACEVPGFRLVVWERRVGVLKVGNGDYI